eukprot:6911771-Pyramimonas_sp.AAC.1
MEVYLTSGIVLKGTTIDELIVMGQLIQSIRTSWLANRDFDAEPHVVDMIGWPTLVDGTFGRQ